MQSQLNLRLYGQANPPITQVSNDEVALCSSEQDAYRMCVNKAIPKRTNHDMAELLGMSEAQFSRILNADYHKVQRHAGRVFQIELQRVCNNRVIDQWAALYEAGMLNCQRTLIDRKAELLAELADLEQQTKQLDRLTQGRNS